MWLHNFRTEENCPTQFSFCVDNIYTFINLGEGLSYSSLHLFLDSYSEY